MMYRKRFGSDTWHYMPKCRWWPAKALVANWSRCKPKSGELCNECRSKKRRAG